jgi:medium-chain acyl-[acyl-carrier-protein] hydrolase
MNVYNQEFLIQYADIDPKNRLSIYGFFKYLQEIACIHAETLGYGLNSAPRTGFVWILLDWKVKILDYPKWNEKILVKTWPSKADLISCYRDFEIYNEKNELIAYATSKWILFDISKKRISKVTPEVRNVFSPIEKRVFENEIEKLEEPAEYESSSTYTISRRDIDTNGHVNNLNYIHFALDALPENIYENQKFNHIEIMYKKQCLLGDTICSLYTSGKDESIVTIKSKDFSKLHAIVRFKNA